MADDTANSSASAAAAAKDAASNFGKAKAGSATVSCPQKAKCPCATPQKSPKGGNTTVQVDQASKKVVIHSRLEYTGPDATEAYAKAAKEEIEKTWPGKTNIDGQEYQVEVKVDTKVTPSGPPTAGYDPINVDSKTNRMNQTLYGAGPGNQTPSAADPKVRRISHEYGHTLGLPDEYHDDPSGAGSVKDDPTKKNNIMAETWPDKKGVMPHPHQDHYDKVLKNYGCQ